MKKKSMAKAKAERMAASCRPQAIQPGNNIPKEAWGLTHETQLVIDLLHSMDKRLAAIEQAINQTNAGTPSQHGGL